ncbi:MAG: hypothetical protein AB7O24_07380 [Kofleriaceae bacterium]
MRVGLIVLALMCRVAFADPDLESSASDGTDLPSEVGSSYRWQIVAADGAGLLLFGALMKLPSSHKEAFGFGRLTPYWVAGPVVHAAHGRWSHAALSVTMRVSLPVLAGYLVGEAWQPTGYGPNTSFIVGLLGGFLATSVFDAIVLGAGNAAQPVRSTHWAPTVNADRQSVGVGVAGAF